jgi:phosphoribosyl-ATP pyrophosphohydrolase
VIALEDIEAVLQERLAEPVEGSYSLTLLNDSELARRKIMEEAFELCLELERLFHDLAPREPLDRHRTASEAADLLFHTLAGLVGAGVSLTSVMEELAERRR